MKKTIYYKVVGIVFLTILFSHVAYAQNERNKALIYSYLHGWEYSIKAGLSIGGTSPLPLPKEIRNIDSYSPNIAIAIEGNATKWFGNDKKWGMTAGIRLENKTMTTEATVKNYGMKIINTNGGELQGLWTGGVKTKVKNSYLTIPVLANYKISDRWKVSLGPYVSYMTEGNFSGHVYEGHLRTPDETGQRVDFSGESVATYDFSDNLRKFQWGAQLGGEWKAFKHLNVYADLTWGLNDIFKKDFDTIRRRARTALRLASVFTLPAAIGLGVIATPISTMLYATPNAGPCIAVMSIGIFFLGIQQVTTGILQGLGKTAVPFINLIVSGCVKVAFSWNLTAMPQFGVLGAAFATDTDFAVAAALNLLFMYRYMRFNMDYGHLLKVAIASAVMGVAVYFSFRAIIGAIHSNTLSALLAICIGVVVYALGILLTKAIKPEDVRTMPKIGPKLAAIIEKISF